MKEISIFPFFYFRILNELKAKIMITEQIDNDDILEFNMLSNKSQSDDTLYDVLTDDNWDKYKIKNFQTTSNFKFFNFLVSLILKKINHFSVNQNSDEESKDSELDDEEESFSLHDQV